MWQGIIFSVLPLTFGLVIVPPESQPPAQTQLEVNKNSSRPSGREEIRRLISELDSREFTTRSAADAALEKIGHPALTPLRDAAKKANSLEARSRIEELIRKIENHLDSLLVDYRSFGLPFPGSDAKLVRFIGPGGVRDSRKESERFYLGFQLPANGKEKDTMLLRGIAKRRAGGDQTIQPLDVPRLSRKQIQDVLDQSWLWYQEALPLAAQCKNRGWDLFAEAVLAEARVHSENDSAPSPRRALLDIAWNYWAPKLAEPGTDWKMIGAYLHRLVAADSALDMGQNRALLASLDAALVPSKAKPGTTDARIDALIDCEATDLDYGQVKPDPRYLDLTLHAFEVVPALIEHVDDIRLTRASRLPFNNFRGYQCRIGHVVSDIILGLAGDQLDPVWMTQPEGYGVDKAKAGAWWNRAKQDGEEACLMKLVARPRTVQKNEWFDSFALRLLAIKYPQNLPKMYREVVEENPKVISWPLVDAIQESSLPREEQIALFIRGLKNPNSEHATAAQRALMVLAPARSSKLLIDQLKALSISCDGAYWSSNQVACAYLAAQSRDPGVWQALLDFAKRADVGLRMEILAEMSAYREQPTNQAERIGLLVAFLDDSSLRDAGDDGGKSAFTPTLAGIRDDKYFGPYAGSGFPRLEVRNFAAMNIATILNLNVEWPKGRFAKDAVEWTPEQWTTFRSQVRKGMPDRHSRLDGPR
jgi:hypothetical protein